MAISARSNTQKTCPVRGGGALTAWRARQRAAAPVTAARRPADRGRDFRVPRSPDQRRNWMLRCVVTEVRNIGADGGDRRNDGPNSVAGLGRPLSDRRQLSFPFALPHGFCYRRLVVASTACYQLPEADVPPAAHWQTMPARWAYSQPRVCRHRTTRLLVAECHLRTPLPCSAQLGKPSSSWHRKPLWISR
jgi:hypothetical protein